MENAETIIWISIVIAGFGTIAYLIYSNIKAHSKSADLESKSILDGEKRIHEINTVLTAGDLVERANERYRLRQNSSKK